MAFDHNQAIATLNGLIGICKDGGTGFQTAAKCVANRDLRNLFAAYARQRRQYAAELQVEVTRLGGSPAERGSWSAPVHRAWTNIKSLLGGGSESAVISECERGEDSARDAYADALRNPLPPHIHALLERQFAGIREAHARVRTLEEVTR